MTACPARWTVSGMTCAACAGRLERVVGRVDGVEQARVDFATGMLTFEGSATEDAIRASVLRAGFGAQPVAAPGSADGAEAGARTDLIRAAVAAAFGMQSMMVGIALASPGFPTALVTPVGVAAGLLSGPAVLWAGAPLLRATVASLRSGSFGVDGLVGLGATLTWLASWLAVLDGRTEVWFDTAAMLVGLHVGGRVIEGRVRRRATSAVRALLTLAPVRATREDGRGGVEEVGVSALRVGDRVHVLPATRIPVDGIVCLGRSAVDRALLTGEPTPEVVGPGSLVEAGTLNGEGALVVETVAAEGRRRIDTIAAAVERSLARRPDVVRLADRVATVLVPVIGTVAAATGGWQLARGGSVADALVAAATVIVVTCPCALTLAAPVAVAAAAGTAAERGVIFRDADALDRLATATAVWFDKTGTLTEGALSVRHVALAEGEPAAAVLARGAALAAASPHPAARAVARQHPGTMPAAGAWIVPGDGVEAEIEGRRWRLGRPGWAAAAAPSDEPALDLGRDGVLVARFTLSDRVLPDAGATVARLQALGLGVRVLSGDGSRMVREVADALAIPDADGGLSPEAKAAAIEAAAHAGQRVAFVGDGINDAIAQSAAWVGVAPAGAVDVAAASAGVLLLREGLATLPDAVILARAARRVIRQNLAWALVYNVVAIPFAALGLATPLVAAAAMTASSLTVTFNAARLLRAAGTPLANPTLSQESV
ncbi:MAG: cation-translocating P-type ATPase [Pseudomonadota bacterium]|nr:cation-translocating P-type ATPase [Pseudomonadota bacterium]